MRISDWSSDVCSSDLLADWSSAAKLCTRVLIQVRINDKVATLARDVSTKPKRPMDIFGGEMESALTAPQSAWWRFGYARAESKESFSQALFRLMNMPEVVTDLSCRITINQVLRRSDERRGGKACVSKCRSRCS